MMVVVSFKAVSGEFDSLPHSRYHTRDVAQLGRITGGSRGVKKCGKLCQFSIPHYDLLA